MLFYSLLITYHSIHSMIMSSPAETSHLLIVTVKEASFSTVTDTSTFTLFPSVSPIELPRSRVEVVVLPSLRVKSSCTSFLGRAGGGVPCLGGSA
ncbi:hypothetical protein [Parabacteroides goldsteinii]|uniref:hypothetical protein n=1 Tax=Parabacteroides goldsteinii TaxID=328812 RepID=UPI0025B1BE5C|nr:hypothetical protein [Parabacteroides goldsteinii]